MKTAIQSALTMGLIIASCFAAQAQDDPNKQASYSGAIVVLDVAKVFKSDGAFNQQIAQIQTAAESLKSEVETKQQKLRAEAQNISENLTVNSPDRKSAELKVEQDMTELRTYARQAEADLMLKEAKIYYDTYTRMQGIVAETAEQNGIAMVLRFDSSDIIPDNRNSVVNAVNRAIVYQKDRDLTGYIIERMNPAGGNGLRSAEQNSGTLQK